MWPKTTISERSHGGRGSQCLRGHIAKHGTVGAWCFMVHWTCSMLVIAHDFCRGPCWRWLLLVYTKTVIFATYFKNNSICVICSKCSFTVWELRMKSGPLYLTYGLKKSWFTVLGIACIVLSYVLCNAILIRYVLRMKWMIPFLANIKEFHKRFKESNKFIIFTDITRLLIVVEQENSMSYKICQGQFY